MRIPAAVAALIRLFEASEAFVAASFAAVVGTGFVVEGIVVVVAPS